MEDKIKVCLGEVSYTGSTAKKPVWVDFNAKITLNKQQIKLIGAPLNYNLEGFLTHCLNEGIKTFKQ